MHRVGLGTEFQPLEKNKKMILGGVELNAAKSLKRNSAEEDVLARALCQAIIGALALSDVENVLSEASSSKSGTGSKSSKHTTTLVTLKEVCQAAWARGYVVVNADLVCMAEDLNLTGFRSQMRENLSIAMNVKRQNVGLKSSVGPFGKDAGVFVQAVVLLEKK